MKDIVQHKTEGSVVVRVLVVGLLLVLVWSLLHLIRHPRRAAGILILGRYVALRFSHWPPWKTDGCTAEFSHLMHDAPISFLQEETLRGFGLERDAYRNRQANVRRLARKVSALLEGLGIDHWLESGVLLGINDKDTLDVLEYDADLDISMTHDGVDSLFRCLAGRDGVVSNREGTEWYVRDLGLVLRPGMRNTCLKWVFVDAETDTFCDVFVYKLAGSAGDDTGKKVLIPDGRYVWACAALPRDWKGLVQGFELPIEWIYPTKTVVAGPTEDRFTVRIPARPTECLKYLYGSDLMPRYKWCEKERDFVMRYKRD